MAFKYCDGFFSGCTHYVPTCSDGTCKSADGCVWCHTTESDDAATIIRGLARSLNNQAKIIEMLKQKEK